MEDKKLTLAPEVEEPETAEDTNELYIKFAKPYIFGDKTYTGIDLSGLEDVNGAVLKEAGRVVQKLNKGINPATVEMTMEYAVYMAHHVTNLPSDFFWGLRAPDLVSVKGGLTPRAITKTTVYMSQALHVGIDYLQSLSIDELNDLADAIQDYAREVEAQIGKK